VGDDPADLRFLGAHPEMDHRSIRVEGTFNGQAFVYGSSLEAEQEIRLDPPLVVSAGGAATNLTLRVSLPDWFRGPGGGLVDPATANAGGPNENLVRDNIRASLGAFEDRDHDGHEDHSGS
jgi:hypothetical protein